MAYQTFPDSTDTVVAPGGTSDIVLTDAVTNTTSDVLTIRHRTTGTAANSIGVGIVGYVEDAGGSDQIAYKIRSVLTDATAASEDADFRIALVDAGTVPAEGSEQFRVDSDGNGVLTLSLSTPTVYGGSSSGGHLTLNSTSHATKGTVRLGSSSGVVFDEANTALGIGGTPSSGYAFDVTKVAGGGNVQALLRNQSNTASSRATQLIMVAGSSAGDPMIWLAVDNANYYTIGIDNSDSDRLKISQDNTNADPGVNTALYFETAANGLHATFGGFIQSKTTAGITASTTQTQGQGALTSEINEISTCANANDTVTLPSAVAGRRCIVINNGAQTAQIFPASGDNLGAGVDTAGTLAAGANVHYVAYDGTNWEVV